MLCTKIRSFRVIITFHRRRRRERRGLAEMIGGEKPLASSLRDLGVLCACGGEMALVSANDRFVFEQSLNQPAPDYAGVASTGGKMLRAGNRFDPVRFMRRLLEIGTRPGPVRVQAGEENRR